MTGLSARHQPLPQRQFTIRQAGLSHVGHVRRWRLLQLADRFLESLLARAGFDQEAVLQLDLVQHGIGVKE